MPPPPPPPPPSSSSSSSVSGSVSVSVSPIDIYKADQKTLSRLAVSAGWRNRCHCNWGTDCLRYHLQFLRCRDYVYGRAPLSFQVNGNPPEKWNVFRHGLAVNLLHETESYFDSRGRVYVAPHHFYKRLVEKHLGIGIDKSIQLSTPRSADQIDADGVLDERFRIFSDDSNVEYLYFAVPNHPKAVVAEIVTSTLSIPSLIGADENLVALPPISNRQIVAKKRSRSSLSSSLVAKEQQQPKQQHRQSATHPLRGVRVANKRRKQMIMTMVKATTANKRNNGNNPSDTNDEEVGDHDDDHDDDDNDNDSSVSGPNRESNVTKYTINNNSSKNDEKSSASTPLSKANNGSKKEGKQRRVDQRGREPANTTVDNDNDDSDGRQPPTFEMTDPTSIDDETIMSQYEKLTFDKYRQLVLDCAMLRQCVSEREQEIQNLQGGFGVTARSSRRKNSSFSTNHKSSKQFKVEESNNRKKRQTSVGITARRTA